MDLVKLKLKSLLQCEAFQNKDYWPGWNADSPCLRKKRMIIVFSAAPRRLDASVTLLDDVDLYVVYVEKPFVVSAEEAYAAPCSHRPCLVVGCAD